MPPTLELAKRINALRFEDLPAWANPLDIVQPGIASKQYPCGGITLSAKADQPLGRTSVNPLPPHRIQNGSMKADA